MDERTCDCLLVAWRRSCFLTWTFFFPGSLDPSRAKCVQINITRSIDPGYFYLLGSILLCIQTGKAIARVSHVTSCVWNGYQSELPFEPYLVASPSREAARKRARGGSWVRGSVHGSVVWNLIRSRWKATRCGKRWKPTRWSWSRYYLSELRRWGGAGGEELRIHTCIPIFCPTYVQLLQVTNHQSNFSSSQRLGPTY
jgi:hypothetical protein